MPKAKKIKVTGQPQKSELDANGREIPNSVPFAASLGKSRARSIRENVLEIVRSEAFRRAREEEGEETFEDADDFEVDDDFDPSSPYEEYFEGEYAYNTQQRQEAKKEATNARRRGRQAAPRDAESVKETTPSKANAPEPAPTVPQDGPART